MTAPYYVQPEQLMKDNSDYARKVTARGRTVPALPPPGPTSAVAGGARRAAGPEACTGRCGPG